MFSISDICIDKLTKVVAFIIACFVHNRVAPCLKEQRQLKIRLTEISGVVYTTCEYKVSLYLFH